MKKSISRREFLRGAGASAGIAALASLGFAGHAAAEETEGNVTFADTIPWNAEYDAVVVGFGGAGAIAAIDMADAGLDVPEIFLWAAAITLSGLMQYRKLRKAVITVFRL